MTLAFPTHPRNERGAPERANAERTSPLVDAPVISASLKRQLDDALQLLLIHQDRLSKDQINHLLQTFTPITYSPSSEITATDIHREIEAQHLLVKAIRERLLHRSTGAIREDFETRDAREMLTAFNSYLSLLLKSREKLDKDKEMMEMERAFIETVKQFPSEQRDSFFNELQRRMSS